ncbi:EmrB/QacA subfamily drug resistance transporter [Virgibacillus natechei]|uniref:EmrB/QacA subfamily drug resistance transporter n=1 Tax=Virgibacillus natechei TaxID=1216297 RepID=A0ABS4ICC3_9BACI|nr:MDR family MFS transporter [Virgibacillus natechei]MBP1968592.1 EmrB/QacA subfamily drug resistance transporter [Virgibacillus natechei]UZD13702.1 multidrug efflux MFS transporter [Virgibacillus natechei]
MNQNKSDNKILIASLLIAGSFIAILNQTLMITAIPPIMEEMNISANTAQWLTTVFMLVNGIMIPITAFLIEKFTTRQLFLTAMAIFTLGTLLGGLATNFPSLITARIIQSAGAGVMMPLMQTVFLLIFPVERRGTAMGYIGLVISFAPAIGPTISGWVTSNYEWRYLFWGILPLALIMMVVAYYIMRNVTERKHRKVDPASVILSTIGFGSLLYGFTSAGNNGWGSPITFATLAIGLASLVIFTLRQLRMEQPMLELRVFKQRMFTLSTIICSIGFLGLIGLETIIPLYLQNMRGFTAMEAGLVLLPGALLAGLMAPITGRIFDRFGSRALAIPGLVLMSLSTFAFLFIDTTTSLVFISVMFAIRMFGFSMVMMPVNTAGLNTLPPKLIPHGAAVTNTTRQVGASIGTAILVTTMTTTADAARSNSSVANPDIFGAIISLGLIGLLTAITLLLSFQLKRTYPPTDAEWDEAYNQGMHRRRKKA